MKSNVTELQAGAYIDRLPRRLDALDDKIAQFSKDLTGGSSLSVLEWGQDAFQAAAQHAILRNVSNVLDSGVSLDRVYRLQLRELIADSRSVMNNTSGTSNVAALCKLRERAAEVERLAAIFDPELIGVSTA
jgi:hypothetical protein